MSGHLPAPAVQLSNPGWVACGRTTARGYAHLGDRFLTSGDLARYLEECGTEEAWRLAIARLNGCFAAVTERDDTLLAAVDRIRSIPLFYGAGDRGPCVSDDACRVLDAAPAGRLHPLAAEEFRLTGYVTGANTLMEGVYQVQAGELVRLGPARTDVHRSRYYAFRHRHREGLDEREYIARLDEVHRTVFQRLARSAEGRPLIVPLSGGYDSRLIAVSLRDLGIRDVVCYTYGPPDHWEIKISQELARHLGFRWEFVPYSARRWREALGSPAFRAYGRAAGNLVSIPHVQDWPAVQELHREKRIPADAVFVPGHTGDFLFGGHIPRHFIGRRISRRAFLDTVYGVHYSLWDWPADSLAELVARFDERVESIVGRVGECSSAEAADLYERWELQERQAKFICNAVRVYEHFGYDWRLPLFDHELMDFWAAVPVELRARRHLYRAFVRERQRLPVGSPNADRGAMSDAVVAVIDATGLRLWAKALQRLLRRYRWRHAYATSFLGSFAIVHPKFFRRTYTGKELVHSYVAVAYRDSIVRPGMATTGPSLMDELGWKDRRPEPGRRSAGDPKRLAADDC